MNKGQEILSKAEQLAASCDTWADLSNALFDPAQGLIAQAYPTRAQREEFVKTREYKAIRGLVATAVERTGLVEGATPHKSGRFVVRLPKTLHAALEREAAAEGVSLNQLVVVKLSVGLGKLTETSST